MRSRTRIALDWLKPVGVVAVVACHRPGALSPPPPESAPEPSVVSIAILASPDSTIRLAKFAMGTIDAILQLPQTRQDKTVVSTRYARTQRGGGQTEIAIIAIVSREVADTLKPVTFVRLSAWALDTREELVIPQLRRGNAVTPRATLAMASGQPRPITTRDAADWEALQLVLGEFMRHGARRVP